MLHHEMPDCAEKHILVLLHYLQREEQKDQGIVHQCLERLKQAIIAENINIPNLDSWIQQPERQAIQDPKLAKSTLEKKKHR